jgi:tetratricopeptide (TPR) repeat protein
MKIAFYLMIIVFLFNSCTPKAKRIENYLKDGIEKTRDANYKAALEDFTNIIKLDADNHEAYYYRGNAKFNLKDGRGALIDYNKAIELKPDYADAFYNRGFCKQYLNDKNGACSDWDKAAVLGKPDVKDMLNYCR